MRLQIGDQERGGRSFSRNIADYKANPLLAKVQKIVVVTAYVACLDAEAGVVERGKQRLGLRKESRLCLGGKCQFLDGAAFGFQSVGVLTTVLFDFTGHLVES